MRTPKLTLRKRKRDRDNPLAPYYVEFEIRGKRFPLCTGTHIKSDAKTKATALYNSALKAALGGDASELRAAKLRRPASPPMPEVWRFYLGASPQADEAARKANPGAPVRAGAKARRNNVLACKDLLRKCGVPGDPSTWRGEHVTAEVSLTWFGNAKAAAEAAPDPDSAHRILTSAISYWNQANSLFTEPALDYYRLKGCYSPTFEEFTTAGRKFIRTLPATTAEAGGNPYRPPAPEIIARTLTAWKNLDDRSLWNIVGPRLCWDDLVKWKSVTARDVFLGVGHILTFGLRRAEFAQAKWEWWSTLPGYPILDAHNIQVKKGSRELCVRALDPFFSVLAKRIEKEGWRGAADDYITPGHKTYRTDFLFRVIGAWMRGLGWETEKTNHAFRAYSGSLVAMRWSIEEARHWLRHEEQDMTEGHYLHFVDKYRPANRKDVGVEWATLEHCPRCVVSVRPADLLADLPEPRPAPAPVLAPARSLVDALN